MPVIRAQVVLPFRSNLPEDVITNTFHFGVDEILAPSAWEPLITGALTNFYLDAYDLGMASYVNLPACHINYYDLSDPPPRIPLIDTSIGTAFGTSMTTQTSQIPNEVACVLSFEAPPVSGLPQGRRRGRVYLGALGELMLSASSTTAPYFPLLEAAFITDVLGAAQAHLLTVGDTVGGDIEWAVYSVVNDQAYTVVQGWVDNSPDTQRRRGVLATVRSLFPIPA